MKLSTQAIDLIRPYLDQHVAMVTAINKLTDEELEALRSAAAEHDETNCWFRAFDAAQIVRTIVRDEMAHRRAALSKDTTNGDA